MNGTAIPTNSSAMRDMVTYMAFLSRGIPPGSEMKGQGVPELDPVPGRHGSRTRDFFFPPARSVTTSTAAAIPLFRHCGERTHITSEREWRG
jgi:hypothetical protein